MTTQSQEEFIVNNMNIVKNIASKYYTDKIGLDYEDLVSYGVMGLIDARKKFDESRGVKFSTYASIRVSSFIIDEIRKYSPVSRTYMSKIKEYNKCVDQLQQKLFRKPSEDEIAQYMDITKKEVRNMIVKDKVRPDNRLQNEIRPIWCEVGVLPRTHGSAVFTRGQTQVMSITTLAGLPEVQEDLEDVK